MNLLTNKIAAFGETKKSRN